MANEITVLKDYLFQMWVIQFPTVLGINLLLYLIFVWRNINSLVDFGWALNQWVVGMSLLIQNYKLATVKTYVIAAVLTIWFLRLGGFLFVTRVLKGVNDRRYEQMQQAAISQRKLWFLFQYVLQGKVISYSGHVPGHATLLRLQASRIRRVEFLYWSGDCGVRNRYVGYRRPAAARLDSETPGTPREARNARDDSR